MGSGFKDWTAGDVLTAADVDGYLMRQTVMTFADASARDTALSGVLDEGMVAYLEDTDEVTVYDGSDWVIYAGRGYSYVQTVYFTTSGTFTKATYPWLRAVKVIAQGGGGGGGGVAQPASTGESGAGAGGSGGGWAETFITDIAGMASSVTVTVGAGGSGGAAGNNDGTAGGSSSFGSDAVATGGAFGQSGLTGSTRRVNGSEPAGVGTTGDIVGGGQAGQYGIIVEPGGSRGAQPGNGGASRYGRGGEAYIGSANPVSAVGGNGVGYGAGGAGAAARYASGPAPVARAGGDGTGGIVIVELYA